MRRSANPAGRPQANDRLNSCCEQLPDVTTFVTRETSMQSQSEEDRPHSIRKHIRAASAQLVKHLQYPNGRYRPQSGRNRHIWQYRNASPCRILLGQCYPPSSAQTVHRREETRINTRVNLSQALVAVQIACSASGAMVLVRLSTAFCFAAVGHRRITTGIGPRIIESRALFGGDRSLC